MIRRRVLRLLFFSFQNLSFEPSVRLHICAKSTASFSVPAHVPSDRDTCKHVTYICTCRPVRKVFPRKGVRRRIYHVLRTRELVVCRSRGRSRGIRGDDGCLSSGRRVRVWLKFRLGAPHPLARLQERRKTAERRKRKDERNETAGTRKSLGPRKGRRNEKGT